MNIAERGHQFVRSRVLAGSSADGRIWVLVAAALCLALIVLASQFVPYQQVLAPLGIPPLPQVFDDLRAVLAAFEGHRKGYDVFVYVPRDILSEGSLGYPRLWMNWAWLGLDRSDRIAVGIVAGICFYLVTLSFIGRLNRFEGVLYALVLCSPPTILLLERGNVDMYLYFLLLLTLVAVSRDNVVVRFLGYVLVLVPSGLKFLPLFTLGALVKENRNRFILFTTIVVSAFIVYYLSIRDEVKAIRSIYGGTEEYAFGAKLLYWGVVGAIKTFTSGVHVGNRSPLAAGVGLAATALFAAGVMRMVSCAYGRLKRWLQAPSKASQQTIEGGAAALYVDAFRASAALYVLTFLVGIVFDYKLVFLVLTMPLMLHWIRHDSPLGQLSSWALLGIVSTLYLSPFLSRWLLDEIVNWLLWLYFVYTFALLLPDWMKATIHKLLSPLARASPSAAH